MKHSLQELPKSEQPSLKSLNYHALNSVLDDQISLKDALSPEQMLLVMSKCLEMSQNKELQNKLRTAMTVTYPTEYNIDHMLSFCDYFEKYH